MFRKMRKTVRQMPEDTVYDVLGRNTSGVLALLDENGYTYGVPLSYALCDNKLYFHGAKAGAKLDALKHHDAVSFTVIDRDEVVGEEFRTRFRSVIAFGRVRVVSEEAERREAFWALGRKYAPNVSDAHIERYISNGYAGTVILALDMEYVTGKQAEE